ncbi:MAG TPA: tRNA 2-thiocytidine(32) synthetase TtcA [Gammaproteobacteria bacterium]|nr:tRNA 2-thiocytidine(32) synthetase TtcA [Gammaproteobacteria bacterium]
MSQRIELHKLQKRLMRQLGQAVSQYQMIEDGDRIMVCLSGGKDSYTLLELLLAIRERAPVDFELLAVNLDQKQPDFPAHVLPEYLAAKQIPFHIIEQDTYSVVQRVVAEGKTQCALCSRLRRGSLYTFAKQQGITKIALGHHRDDLMETFFLNLFYNGKLKAMPPKLRTDDGAHIVIRPLCQIREKDIAEYAEMKQFPIIPCNLCGSQPNLKRQMVKQMLQQWEQEDRHRLDVIHSALQNVEISHLADAKLFDFVGLYADENPSIDEGLELVAL